MRYSGIFVLLLFCFLLIACTGNLQPVSNSKEYFNIENYFLVEAEELTKQNTGIVKTMFKEDASEKLIDNNVNWFTELKPFMDIALNKPALANAYHVDSILNNNRKVLLFQAKDDNPFLQNLKIIFTNNKPDTVIAINRTSNMYYRSKDTLSYFGNGSYRISSWNKPRFGREVSFVLETISNGSVN